MLVEILHIIDAMQYRAMPMNMSGRRPVKSESLPIMRMPRENPTKYTLEESCTRLLPTPSARAISGKAGLQTRSVA